MRLKHFVAFGIACSAAMLGACLVAAPVIPDSARIFAQLAYQHPPSAAGPHLIEQSHGCDLPPLDISTMKLWAFDRPWHASEWSNTGSSIPWRFDHIRQHREDVVLNIDHKGAPQLQAVEGTKAATQGLWQADITLPTTRSGVIVAPLWLYNSKTRDEVDFELAGNRGVDVSVHSYATGTHRTKTIRLFGDQDLSGMRLCFGIRIAPGEGRIEMLVNNAIVYTWQEADGLFVTDPLRPFIEMWSVDPANAGLVQWAGPFSGFGQDDNMEMTVHGYSYSPL